MKQKRSAIKLAANYMRMDMRFLWVNNTEFEVSDQRAEELLQSGALYPCGEEHDLHLTPDHLFTLGEVEMLLNLNPDDTFSADEVAGILKPKEAP